MLYMKIHVSYKVYYQFRKLSYYTIQKYLKSQQQKGMTILIKAELNELDDNSRYFLTLTGKSNLNLTYLNIK